VKFHARFTCYHGTLTLLVSLDAKDILEAKRKADNLTELVMPFSFRWVQGLEGLLAGSAKPHHEAQIDWLIDQGIQSLVSLSPLDMMIEKYLGRNAIAHLNCLVPDFGTPVPSQLKIFTDFLHRQLEESHPVLVHCAAGQGRTGTLLASYLIQRGEDLNQAIGRTGGYPESTEQMEFLNALANEDFLSA